MELLDQNDNYPFGMNHLQTGSSRFGMGSWQNYKYNGKELQASGMYDYGARFYMPDIGIFGQHDPLSEKTGTPYAYVNNNPIRFIDPTGMEPEDCPTCPKPSYEGQTIQASDGRTYGAARQQGDTAWIVPTKPLEWLPQTDIEEVTMTGKSKSLETDISPKQQNNSSIDFKFPPQGGGVIMMDGIWDLFGIALANTKTENKYIAGAIGVGAIILSKGRATDDVLKAESNLWKVGTYSELKGTQVGLNAHHVGQSALMKKMVESYSHSSAPSILVPEVGHIFKGPFGRISTSTSGLTTPRQVLARDIMELRRVYGSQGIPNSSLQQLIQMNKTMYPAAFTK